MIIRSTANMLNYITIGIVVWSILRTSITITIISIHTPIIIIVTNSLLRECKIP